MAMADRYAFTAPAAFTYTPAVTDPPTGTMRELQEHAPNSAQLVGFLTFIISGGILLLLTGLIITAAILGLIFFTPLILISSPIWVPLGAVLFIAIAGFLSVCASGVAAVTALSWMYRYFRGFHPPGSDCVDDARSRIYDTASHVKDYAREYVGYLHPNFNSIH